MTPCSEFQGPFHLTDPEVIILCTFPKDNWSVRKTREVWPCSMGNFCQIFWPHHLRIVLQGTLPPPKMASYIRVLNLRRRFPYRCLSGRIRSKRSLFPQFSESPLMQIRVRTVSPRLTLTKNGWTSVLRLSTFWHFPKYRKMAMVKLEKKGLTPQTQPKHRCLFPLVLKRRHLRKFRTPVFNDKTVSSFGPPLGVYKAQEAGTVFSKFQEL